MDKITLQMGGKPVTFIVTDYCLGSNGSWDEPAEPPYIEWYAQNQIVDAVIDEFDIAGEIEERLLDAIERGLQESQTEAAIEREMGRMAI